jgi:hypothetical protein
MTRIGYPIRPRTGLEEPRQLQRSYETNVDEGIVFESGVPIGVVRRHDNQYVGIARGGLGIRALGSSPEAAATNLRRVLAEQKIRFRTDGVMSKFV